MVRPRPGPPRGAGAWHEVRSAIAVGCGWNDSSSAPALATATGTRSSRMRDADGSTMMTFIQGVFANVRGRSDLADESWW